MALKQYQPGGGIMQSKALKVGIGALTGGIGGAVMGAVGGTPAGAAAGVAKDIGAFSGGSPSDAATPSVEPLKLPKIGESLQGNSPISRRLSLLDQDPSHALSQGLSALNDPNLPDDVRQEVAPILLKAKYFGGIR